jgi:hypothetical protein
MTRAIAGARRHSWLRRLLYLACGGASLAVVSGYGLYAQARESALGFGAELAQIGELGAGAEALLINGQRFQHLVDVRDGQPAQLLDQVQAECARERGGFGEALAQLAEAAARSGAAPASSLRQGVLRSELGGRGMIVCFAGAGGGGLAAFAEQLAELLRSGRLGALGRVRYVYAELIAPGRSRVSALWTDESLDPGAMFPSTGDVPGSDSPWIPRPPASRRTLSATAEGTPFTLLGYASQLPPPELQRFYAQRLAELGFQPAAAAPEATAYQRPDGAQLFLSLFAEGGATQVTMIESRAGAAGVEVGE